MVCLVLCLRRGTRHKRRMELGVEDENAVDLYAVMFRAALNEARNDRWTFEGEL